MKLRIKGNSLRFRVTRSELMKLYETGRLDEAVYFSHDGYSNLIYALEHKDSPELAILRYESPEISISLSSAAVQDLIRSDRRGIYTTIDLGNIGSLELLIEKDYELLDREEDIAD